ncbi:Uncharacterised protein [Vibrio cholerae]|nr:Uncharacterised protein [Vibrio cholerae]
MKMALPPSDNFKLTLLSASSYSSLLMKMRLVSFTWSPPHFAAVLVAVPCFLFVAACS